MKFFTKRCARKELKETLHHARHVRHMHEDIADPELIGTLHDAERAGRAAYKKGDAQLMSSADEMLSSLCEKIAPPIPKQKMRDHVEIYFVAIAAAMAIRAYFLQPFKIPTGSMQPTLYGITMRNVEEGEADHLPARIANFIWKGEVYLEKNTFFDRLARGIAVGKGYFVPAQVSGLIPAQETAYGTLPVFRDNFDTGMPQRQILVGSTAHRIPPQMLKYCRAGEYIQKGESLFRAVAKAGDYILVNRIAYNFFPPKRGDVVVFDARDVARDAYYIKRMVGLPGETISIDPPYLKVNGKTPGNERFKKLFNNDEYSGYVFGRFDTDTPPLIGKPGDAISLADAGSTKRREPAMVPPNTFFIKPRLS